MLDVDGLLTRLWTSAGILRDSPYNPEEVLPRYVPAFLLVKWLADNVDTLNASSAFRDFVIPASVNWSEINRSHLSVGESISRALSDLERANPNLSGLADGLGLLSAPVDRTERDHLLRGFAHFFTELDLGVASAAQPDVAARALSLFLDRVAGTWRSGSGTFATPPSVSSLVVALADPEEGMRISDPTTGWGGFLATCARKVAEATGKSLVCERVELELDGQERQPAAAAIAQVVLVLSGVPRARIVAGDVLRQPAFIESDPDERPRLRRYDLVVSHPPFGLREWGFEASHDDHFGRFIIVPPRHASDFAFVQHALASLNERGRAVLVLTPGALFRPGKEEDIREHLVRANLLDAVIALPRNLFYDTVIAPVLLLLDRARDKERHGKLLVVDATSLFERARPRNILSSQHIERVVAVHKAYKEEPGLARLVSVGELEARKWDLNVSTYFAAQGRIEIPDPRMELARAHSLENERDATAHVIDEIVSRLDHPRDYP